MTVLKQEVLTIISHLPDRIELDLLIRRFQRLAREQTTETAPPQAPRSFLDAARQYAGCITDAPPDLSTNSRYMEGYGE